MHTVGTITGLVVGFVLFAGQVRSDDKAPVVQTFDMPGVGQLQRGAA